MNAISLVLLNGFIILITHVHHPLIVVSEMNRSKMMHLAHLPAIDENPEANQAWCLTKMFSFELS